MSQYSDPEQVIKSSINYSDAKFDQLNSHHSSIRSEGAMQSAKSKRSQQSQIQSDYEEAQKLEMSASSSKKRKQVIKSLSSQGVRNGAIRSGQVKRSMKDQESQLYSSNYSSPSQSPIKDDAVGQSRTDVTHDLDDVVVKAIDENAVNSSGNYIMSQQLEQQNQKQSRKLGGKQSMTTTLKSRHYSSKVDVKQHQQSVDNTYSPGQAEAQPKTDPDRREQEHFSFYNSHAKQAEQVEYRTPQKDETASAEINQSKKPSHVQTTAKREENLQDPLSQNSDINTIKAATKRSQTQLEDYQPGGPSFLNIMHVKKRQMAGRRPKQDPRKQSPEYIYANNQNIQNYIFHQRPRTSIQRSQQYASGSIKQLNLHSNAILQSIVKSSKNSDIGRQKKPSPPQNRLNTFERKRLTESDSHLISQFQAGKKRATANSNLVDRGMFGSGTNLTQAAIGRQKRNSIGCQSYYSTQNTNIQTVGKKNSVIHRNQDYHYGSVGNADSAFDTSIKDIESRLDQSYNKKKKQLNRETREKISQSMLLQMPDADSLHHQSREDNMAEKALNILKQQQRQEQNHSRNNQLTKTFQRLNPSQLQTGNLKVNNFVSQNVSVQHSRPNSKDSQKKREYRNLISNKNMRKLAPRKRSSIFTQKIHDSVTSAGKLSRQSVDLRNRSSMASVDIQEDFKAQLDSVGDKVNAVLGVKQISEQPRQVDRNFNAVVSNTQILNSPIQRTVNFNNQVQRANTALRQRPRTSHHNNRKSHQRLLRGSVSNLSSHSREQLQKMEKIYKNRQKEQSDYILNDLLAESTQMKEQIESQNALESKSLGQKVAQRYKNKKKRSKSRRNLQSNFDKKIQLLQTQLKNFKNLQASGEQSQFARNLYKFLEQEAVNQHVQSNDANESQQNNTNNQNGRNAQIADYPSNKNSQGSNGISTFQKLGGFYSNHIQNLTINALDSQLGFDVRDIQSKSTPNGVEQQHTTQSNQRLNEQQNLPYQVQDSSQMAQNDVDMFSLNHNIVNAEIYSEQQANSHSGRLNDTQNFHDDQLNPRNDMKHIERVTSAHVQVQGGRNSSSRQLVETNHTKAIIQKQQHQDYLDDKLLVIEEQDKRGSVASQNQEQKIQKQRQKLLNARTGARDSSQKSEKMSKSFEQLRKQTPPQIEIPQTIEQSLTSEEQRLLEEYKEKLKKTRHIRNQSNTASLAAGQDEYVSQEQEIATNEVLQQQQPEQEMTGNIISSSQSDQLNQMEKLQRAAEHVIMLNEFNNQRILQENAVPVPALPLTQNEITNTQKEPSNNTDLSPQQIGLKSNLSGNPRLVPQLGLNSQHSQNMYSENQVQANANGDYGQSGSYVPSRAVERSADTEELIARNVDKVSSGYKLYEGLNSYENQSNSSTAKQQVPPTDNYESLKSPEFIQQDEEEEQFDDMDNQDQRYENPLDDNVFKADMMIQQTITDNHFDMEEMSFDNRQQLNDESMEHSENEDNELIHQIPDEEMEQEVQEEQHEEQVFYQNDIDKLNIQEEQMQIMYESKNMQDQALIGSEEPKTVHPLKRSKETSVGKPNLFDKFIEELHEYQGVGPLYFTEPTQDQLSLSSFEKVNHVVYNQIGSSEDNLRDQIIQIDTRASNDQMIDQVTEDQLWQQQQVKLQYIEGLDRQYNRLINEKFTKPDVVNENGNDEQEPQVSYLDTKEEMQNELDSSIVVQVNRVLDDAFRSLYRRRSMNNVSDRMNLRHAITVDEEGFQIQKVIEVDDLNMDQQLDPNSDRKMQKIYKDDQDLSIQELRKKEKAITEEIHQKLSYHLQRVNLQFLMVTKLEYQSYEQDLFIESRLRNREKLGQTVTKSELLIQREEEQFDNFAQYVDLVWSNKNNKVALIKFKNSRRTQEILDSMTSDVTLFDIMTTISNYNLKFTSPGCHKGRESMNDNNMYNCIDWELIKNKVKEFEDKQTRSVKILNADFQEKITFIINENFNLERNSIYNKKTLNLQQLLLSLPPIVIRTVNRKFKETTRVFPLLMKYKTGICTRKMLAYSNLVFEERLEPLVIGQRYDRTHRRFEEFEKDVQMKVDDKRLSTSFRQYKAQYLVNRKEQKKFANLVFRCEHVSIYYKLFDPDNESIMYVIMCHLIKTCKRIFQSQFLGNVNSNTQTIRNLKEMHKEYKVKALRHNSIDKKKTQSYQKSADDKMVDFDIDNKTVFSDRQGDLDKPYQIRKYQRQGAIDPYHRGYCEFIIMQKLERKINRIKDSQSMFYKNIEWLINEDDQHYNFLARSFGYKSTLFRPQRNPELIMEVYVPILRAKGLKKLQLMKKKNKKEKSKTFSQAQFKEFYEKNLEDYTSSAVKNTKKQHAGYSKKRKVNSKIKIVDAIMVNDISTDESMKHIEFDDIRSRGSDEEMKKYEENEDQDQEQDDDSVADKSKTIGQTKEDRKKQNLEAIRRIQKQCECKTPLQHYNQLSKSGVITMKDGLTHVQANDVSRDSLAQEFLQRQTTDDKNKIFEVVNYDDNREPDETGFLQILKDKYRIDGLIQSTYKNVFQDNLIQIRKYQDKLNYAQTVRIQAIENFGDEALYFESMHGRALEKNLLEMENDALYYIDLYKRSQNLVDLEYKYETDQDGVSSQEVQEYIHLIEQKLREQIENAIQEQEKEEADGKEREEGKQEGDGPARQEDVSYDESATKSAIESNIIKEDTRISVYESFQAPIDEGELEQESIEGIPADVFTKVPTNWQEYIDKQIGLQLLKDMQKLHIDPAKRYYICSQIEQSLLKLIGKNHQGKKTKGDRFCLDSDSELECGNEIEQLKELTLRKNIKKANWTRRQKQKQDLLSKLQYTVKETKLPEVVSTQEVIEQGVLKQIQEQLENNQAQLIEQDDDDVIIVGEGDGVRSKFKPFQIDQLSSINQSLDDYDDHQKRKQDDPNTIEKDGSTLFSGMSVDHSSKASQKQPQDDFIDKMFVAVNDKNVGMMEDILHQYLGAIDNIKNQDGDSVVALAAMKGDHNMLKLLLEKGMTPNTQNKDGNTPLHYACDGKYMRCVDILIQFGIKEDIENNQGLIAWDFFDTSAVQR